MAFEKFRMPGDDDVIWIRTESIIAAKDGGAGPDDEDTTLLLTGPGERQSFYVVGALHEVMQRLEPRRP
jgi:hypothetical protein